MKRKKYETIKGIMHKTTHKTYTNHTNITKSMIFVLKKTMRDVNIKQKVRKRRRWK